MPRNGRSLVVMLALGSALTLSLESLAAEPGAPLYVIEVLPPLPGGGASRALGLDEVGDIAGVSSAPVGLNRGVLWRDGAVMQIAGGPGAGDSAANAVSDAGIAVGFDGTLGSNAFAWQDGVSTPLETYIDCCSQALDVSESGLVVGFAAEGSFGNYKAVKWENGVIESLGFSGRANGVNDLGEIVGRMQLAWAVGFLATADEVIELGTLGGNVSDAFDINNLSQIVGHSTTADGETHPFLWQDGVMIDLDTLPGTDTGTTFAINNFSVAVGETFLYDDFQIRATLWRPGEAPIDLNDYIVTDEDWVLETARDINDAGQIVGDGLYNGQRRGFLLTPILVPGDLDGDGDVDQADLGILLSCYGQSGCGDLDGDGDTDQADLGILLANYGSGV